MADNHVQRFHGPTFFGTSNSLVKPAFLAPPGGFEPPTCDLGTRCSGQVFDQVRLVTRGPSGTLIPKPSQNCGSLAVRGGKLMGGG